MKKLPWNAFALSGCFKAIFVASQNIFLSSTLAKQSLYPNPHQTLSTVMYKSWVSTYPWFAWRYNAIFILSGLHHAQQKSQLKKDPWSISSSKDWQWRPGMLCHPRRTYKTRILRQDNFVLESSPTSDSLSQHSPFRISPNLCPF